MEISHELACETYQRILSSSVLTSTKAVIVYLKDILNNRLDLLERNFPENTLHAVAIKSCDQIDVLSHIIDSGHGLEAASLEEVLLAKRAGAANDHIVFDSPVKTRDEIRYCHENLPGMLLNANSLDELDRYPEDFNCKAGLRINTLVQNTAPSIFNVSSSTSKFGVPISFRDEIVAACVKHSYVTCLHVHIGSHLKGFANNLEAIEILVSLATDINMARKAKGIEQKIDTLDIGGGIDFDVETGSNTVSRFTEELARIPGLLDNFRLITEYGRFVHRQCSFVVSDVEYVLPGGDKNPSTVLIHVGADLFVRKVYSDLPIDYPFTFIHKSPKENRKQMRYNIAGPLCFAGDVLFENVVVDEIEPDDKIIIYDIGANTYSMWSKHCNRTVPPFVFI